MIFRIVLNSLKRNRIINFLIIIQLAIVICIVVVLIGIIRDRLKYYIPFYQEFSKDGFLFNIDLAPEELFQEDFINCDTWLSYTGMYSLADNSSNISDPDFVIMDKKWTDLYTPKMREGKWLNQMGDDGMIHAVVTPNNPLDLKLNDVISVEYDEKVVDISVCGIMEDYQYVIGHNGFSQTDIYGKKSFLDMYYTYDSKKELMNGGHYGIILSKEEIDQSSLKDGYMVNGICLLTCKNANEYVLKQIRDKLRFDYLSDYVVSYSEVRANSFEYIKERFYTLFPIAVCIFILTLVSTISSIVITLYLQLRLFAIIYICGARWRECVTISIMCSFIIAMVSFVFSIAFCYIPYVFGYNLSISRYEIIGVIVIIAAYMFVSIITSLIVFYKNTPKEVLIMQ